MLTSTLQTTSSPIASKSTSFSEASIKKVDADNIIDKVKVVSKANIGASKSGTRFFTLELD